MLALRLGKASPGNAQPVREFKRRERDPAQGRRSTITKPREAGREARQEQHRKAWKPRSWGRAAERPWDECVRQQRATAEGPDVVVTTVWRPRAAADQGLTRRSLGDEGGDVTAAHPRSRSTVASASAPRDQSLNRRRRKPSAERPPSRSADEGLTDRPTEAKESSGTGCGVLAHRAQRASLQGVCWKPFPHHAARCHRTVRSGSPATGNALQCRSSRNVKTRRAAAQVSTKVSDLTADKFRISWAAKPMATDSRPHVAMDPASV